MICGCKKAEPPVSLHIIMPGEGDTVFINHPLKMAITVVPDLINDMEFSLSDVGSVMLQDTPYVYQWPTRNLEEGAYYCSVTVTDEEGRVQHDSVKVVLQFARVVIGGQVWMKENLRRTIYSDGTPIESVYAYDDDTGNISDYGLLYTWSSVMHNESPSDNIPSGVQGACPDGWHVPSREELNMLIQYLGGQDIAGGKMKEVGYDYWISPNDGATNSAGFTAYGAGERDPNGTYNRLKKNAGFWSCTETSKNSSTAVYQCLTAIHPITRQWNDPKTIGYSLRCIKNK
jgi:uncharacterized protein (TIGR02145 family)